MGRKKKGVSDPTKPANYFFTKYGFEHDVETGGVATIAEVWRKFTEYLDGVPSATARRESYEYGKALVADAWLSRVAEIKETLEEKSRWRPAYFNIVLKLIETNPELLVDWARGVATHREVAEATGYKVSTVRDAKWAFRKAGLW